MVNTVTTIDLRNNDVTETEGAYRYHIIADAMMFVIPNPGVSINSLCCWQERYKKSAEINNVDISDDDEWIELWFHSEELDSENICDHGFCYSNDDGINVRVCAGAHNHIPAKVLDNIKEGETIEWNFEAPSHKRGSEEEPQSVLLTLNLTAQQKGYRYSRFGNFEDVVKLVQH